MPDTAIQRIGRYEILQEIGRGAMGVVFKARDPLIGRSVAVKTITSGVAESKDLLERFYREARAAGGLQHPNIVTIYELAESGGAPFIAMEYLEGESLDKLIARKPALPLATKAGYLLQACRALDYAHRRGVIHRDVKPANIVVTREGVVKVVDFGIARLGDASHTQTGTVLGTLAYMSPERVRGEQADARGDIWALGVVLYELLAYQRPFAGENHAALLMNILQQEPPSIRQFVPQCPAALEKVLLKALQKDERFRYPSMEAFLKNMEDVNAALARDPRTATPAAIPTAGAGEFHAAKPGAEATVQCAPTIRVASPIVPATLSAGATLAESGLPRMVTPPPSTPSLASPGTTPAHPVRKALVFCATLAVIVVGGIAVLRRDPDLSAAVSMATNRAWTRMEKVPLPAVAARVLPRSARTTQTPSASSAGPQTSPATPTSDGAMSDASSDAIAQSGATAASSVEDQQRYLINLAQQAAGRQDYTSAQEQLDEATKLNGPLNDSIADLRRQFTAQAQADQLQSVARDEQTLWDKATEYLSAGEFDDAEASLRDILTLPEGGHHWADAARYVDQVIPERRQEEQLWAAVQQQANSKDPGHLLAEVKALDDVLAFGGWHEQGARQKRDALIAAVIRGEAERNRAVAALSAADEWQMTRMKNHFDDLVQKGDTAALADLQQLQGQFKSVAETQGPLAFDARDYVNNIVPQAESHITDRLALAQANSAANAAFLDAVKEYDRAIAAPNAPALRDKILPLFTGIAQSGGIRAKEAQHYVDVLIPAALNKSGQ